MQDHIGSSKIHSKLNNEMNSKSQVQHKLVYGLQCFTIFCGTSAVSSKEKAQVFKINKYLCTHTHTPPYISKLQN